MTDYIERERGLEIFDNWGAVFQTERFEADYAVKVLKQDFSHVPAADVRPVVHGEWVPDDKNIAVHCSECGAAEWYINRGKFCSNCGAQMDGGETE